MKVLACPVCGEGKEVDDKVGKVICAECHITEEAPLTKDGIQGYSSEAFLKLVSVGIDDWRISKDKGTEEKKLIKRFNALRKRGNNLIEIRNKLGIPWKKIKRLEGYRLLRKGKRQKDIAQALEVSRRTISRWNETFEVLNNSITPGKEKNVTFASGNEPPERTSKMNFRRNGNQKVQYNFSPETLKIAKEEDIEKVFI